jgi:hypothetical protein
MPGKAVTRAQEFEAAWNAHDADAVMDFFTDDAVVKLEPPSPEGGSYNGKEEIRNFVRDYIRDFHAESSDHRETEEGKVSWSSEVNAHPFGGLNPVEGMAEAVFREDKIESFTFTFSAATLKRMEPGFAGA